MSEITTKQVLVAPNAIFRYNNEPSFNQNKKLTIVIPGRIDDRRRYYGWINNIPNNQNI